jgi:hypothetical protein
MWAGGRPNRSLARARAASGETAFVPRSSPSNAVQPVMLAVRSQVPARPSIWAAELVSRQGESLRVTGPASASIGRMIGLTTQRLILREMSSADIDDFAALLGDEYVMRYYPRPKTRSEAQGWINWNQALYRDHGFGLWAVVLRSTGEFVGDCGLTPQRIDDSDTDEIEVGYHVRAGLQGKVTPPKRPGQPGTSLVTGSACTGSSPSSTPPTCHPRAWLGR